jgi:hypothetical protein
MRRWVRELDDGHVAFELAMRARSQAPIEANWLTVQLEELPLSGRNSSV